ncbi:MAG: ATP-grasp domain-containing protein [Clostridia bacterium]|nr:ATP-grasp domain-containing protein [Clostridia bacterium]
MKGWLIYDDQGANRNRWFASALCESAVKYGLNLDLVLVKDLQFGVCEGKKAVKLCGKTAVLPDFVICRTIFPILSEFFEELGVPVFNNAEVSRVCNDKRRTHLVFSDMGIGMADTLFFEKHTFSSLALEYPAVLKSNDGHGGKQVFWVNNEKEAEMRLQDGLEKSFLAQKPVTPGRDVRVYLLDNEVIFAALRSCETDFRSNFSLGGKISRYTPSAEMLSVIDRVQDRLSPFYVGIDFTFDEEGRPLLNEIEDVVGARMLYELTDLSLHDLYLDRLSQKLKTQ